MFMDSSIDMLLKKKYVGTISIIYLQSFVQWCVNTFHSENFKSDLFHALIIRMIASSLL